MTAKDKITRGMIAAGAVVTVTSLLVVPHDEASQRLVALMLFMAGVASASVAATVMVLGRVITPVEQSYRIGYQTGYDDGRRADKPLVIDCTTEFRRRSRQEIKGA